ncbi:hypothetical protein [Flammeovirga sp. OC4]|uniref:hypothetical protein n=1 Tax=Flammeovirga sp. OC4 TaxID=1382345 RepID=UPI0005C5F608|nr:hypothetical protein [Flammeovirga sp. OC4]
MKILNTPSKGLVVNTKDFEHIYNATKDVADALASVLTESTAPVRVKGVEFTQNGNNFQCDEGWLLYQNTLHKVDAFNATGVGSEIPVFNLQTVKPSHEPHDLLEGYNKVGTFDFCTEEKLVPEFGASGTGLFDYNEIIKNPVQRNSDAVAQFQGLKPGMITDYYGLLTDFDQTGLGIGDMVGFALCNGQNGTPDLRGRFVIGKGDSVILPDSDNNENANNGYSKIGTVGGASDITLSANQSGIQSHKHSITDKTHNHINGDYNQLMIVDGLSTSAGDTNNDATEPNLVRSGTIQSSYTGITETNYVNASNALESHENRPPFMVLAKIIKLPINI